MIIMTLEGIGISFGDTDLLQNVTQGIEDYDRIGVIGINGTGKSTLLAIIAGAVQPDEGKIISRNGLKISYLPQNPVFDPERNILENVVQNISQDQEFWNVQGEAAAMLLKLGIEDPSAMPETLSGGQRKRAALAAALLTPSDLLILDEPTNHLDHEMIEWLQEQLASYKGALLMITHDRYFLDEVTTIIWEIDRANVYSYPGNYEKYLQTKQERMDFALAAERKMAALYKQDLAWMMRGARARSTKQKAHIQRFEALRDSGTERRSPRRETCFWSLFRPGWETRPLKCGVSARAMVTRNSSMTLPIHFLRTTGSGSSDPMAAENRRF